jgi:hypothetical protein
MREYLKENGYSEDIIHNVLEIDKKVSDSLT